MSEFAVKVVEIEDVLVHPNADKLEILKIADWNCVSAKGNFRKGDRAIYFPIDALLPMEIETKIFGPESKVKLSGSRVRTIKLRGAISQGLVVSEASLGLGRHLVGTDLTARLGITKYEPPAEKTTSVVGKASKKQCNPHFRKYTGIENAKNHPHLFEEGEDVSVTLKIHGTNFRAGYVPFHASTAWKKFKSWLGLAPKYEFVYGSHSVQLQDKMLYKGFYDKNIYAEAVVKYSLREKLKPGQVVYGEIYGSGVQKGYTYGCKEGERKLILFDVMLEGEYIDPLFAKKFAEERQLDFVPVLYKGPFSKETIIGLRDAPCHLYPDHAREGVVVKPIVETKCYVGRKVAKYISDAYLLKNQDDESLAH